jgi:serine/threonine protein kinase
VKILKLSEENIKEFISEIEILGELQNDNIISLVGFCFENDSLILAYEHLPRGSLEEILHGES